AGSLASPMVDDHGTLGGGVNALRRVERAQVVRFLERPIVVDGLVPRDVLRSRNMARALRRLSDAGRRENFAVEFLRAACVDEDAHIVLAGLADFDERGADREIG